MRIFVSYTTRNNEVAESLLLALSNKLSCFGNVFIDLLNNDSVDKQKRIVTELNICDLLVLIESASSNCSEWVRFELRTANELNIPIVILPVNSIDNLTSADLEHKLRPSLSFT